ncbi:GIY-YIG nuclease family protein [Bradyrhizobium sp.]
MPEKFYVYEHWRPDTDMPFYIGKGVGNRAFRFKKNRNRYYRNIVKKLENQGLCVEVKFVANNLSESDALALEIERILFWRERGIKLANLTDGGEGVSGLKHSKETKELLSKISKRTVKLIMADPLIRAKISAAVIKSYSDDPTRRHRQSEKMIRVMSDPDIRDRISSTLTKFLSDNPDAKEKRIQWLKEMASDPAQLYSRIAKATETNRKPEVREARRKSTFDSWQNPEIADRRSKGIKAALAKPEEKARRGEIMRLRMADPIYSAKMSRISKARHQANRNAKAALLSEPQGGRPDPKAAGEPDKDGEKD